MNVCTTFFHLALRLTSPIIAIDANRIWFLLKGKIHYHWKKLIKVLEIKFENSMLLVKLSTALIAIHNIIILTIFKWLTGKQTAMSERWQIFRDLEIIKVLMTIKFCLSSKRLQIFIHRENFPFIFCTIRKLLWVEIITIIW